MVFKFPNSVEFKFDTSSDGSSVTRWSTVQSSGSIKNMLDTRSMASEERVVS